MEDGKPLGAASDPARAAGLPRLAARKNGFRRQGSTETDAPCRLADDFNHRGTESDGPSIGPDPPPLSHTMLQRRPRDKAKVEVAMLIIERWLLGRLRDRRCYSLADLNTTSGELLRQPNDLDPIRRLGVTRR